MLASRGFSLSLSWPCLKKPSLPSLAGCVRFLPSPPPAHSRATFPQKEKGESSRDPWARARSHVVQYVWRGKPLSPSCPSASVTRRRRSGRSRLVERGREGTCPSLRPPQSSVSLPFCRGIFLWRLAWPFAAATAACRSASLAFSFFPPQCWE